MRVGYVDNRGNTFYRCTSCGDSDNPNHAHAFVDRQGNSYCYKCGHVAQLSMTQYLYVQLNMCDIEEVIESDWVPFPLESLLGIGRRETLLTRYIVEDNEQADAFAMRNSNGRLIGYQSRYPKKIMVNEGDRGIDWYNSANSLITSCSRDPIYLVEGPYDVIKPRYVASMGSISLSVFKHVKAQTVWAWPDPDIINTQQKRKKFIDMLNVANDNLCWVEGLIVSDKDPDECTIKYKVPLKEANEHIRKELQCVSY